MNTEDMKTYYEIWSEAWGLFRHWLSELENSDSFFEKANSQAIAYQKKHHKHERLAKVLMMDILEELGRVSATMERKDK